MAHKEVWDLRSLSAVTTFVENLQEHLQGAQPYDGTFRVKDVLVVLEDEEKPRNGDRLAWGLISMDDADETTLQFEQGTFEVGPQ